MKNRFKIIVAVLVLLGCVSSLLADENIKIAQTGMKFTTVPVDARGSALSSAMTSLEGNATSIFYNPAGMARMTEAFSLSVGKMQWIAGINYNMGSIAYAPKSGQYGIFAVSFLAVDYGQLQGTIRADNNLGYLDTGEFNPTAYALGIGFAKALTNRFSVGFHAKYVNQNLGGGVVSFNDDESQNTDKLEKNVWAVDFGLQYRTGYKNLTIGMSLRNFSQEATYYEESFQLPMIFTMGISMNVIETKKHVLLLSVDANHPRDYPEQLSYGLEYTFMNMLILRQGYTFPTDEQGISFGGGYRQTISGFGLNLDYAYTYFGIFKDVHRFTFNFSF